MVKIIKKTFVKRNSRTENRCENHLLVENLAWSYRQRRSDINCLVAHTFRYLESHDLAYTLKITAETQHIILHIDIAQFAHILADQRRLISKIDYFHDILINFLNLLTGDCPKPPWRSSRNNLLM